MGSFGHLCAAMRSTWFGPAYSTAGLLR